MSRGREAIVGSSSLCLQRKVQHIVSESQEDHTTYGQESAYELCELCMCVGGCALVCVCVYVCKCMVCIGVNVCTLMCVQVHYVFWQCCDRKRRVAMPTSKEYFEEGVEEGDMQG